MKYIILALATILILSCETKESSNNYELDLKVISSTNLNLDKSDPPTTDAMFLFEEEGKEYLSYMNAAKNQILVYDLNDEKLINRINLQNEGNQGVGEIKGFMMYNQDTVYITAKSNKKIFVLNKDGIVLDKIQYDTTTQGEYIGMASYSRSDISTPLIKVGSKFYLTNYLYGGYYTYSPQQIDEQKVCIEIDISKPEVQFKQMTFPSGYWLDDKYYEPSYSRIFDGSRFIYMWRYYDKLLVTSDHESVKEYDIKSDYFKSFGDRPQDNDIKLHLRRLLNSSGNFNILWDKERELYYVFFFPGIDVENDDDVINLWKYLPEFSIIVLDKNFKKKGETKMSKNKYYIENAFVGKKGLYLSKNHDKNKDLDENFLSFDILSPDKVSIN